MSHAAATTTVTVLMRIIEWSEFIACQHFQLKKCVSCCDRLLKVEKEQCRIDFKNKTNTTAKSKLFRCQSTCTHIEREGEICVKFHWHEKLSSKLCVCELITSLSCLFCYTHHKCECPSVSVSFSLYFVWYLLFTT